MAGDGRQGTSPSQAGLPGRAPSAGQIAAMAIMQANNHVASLLSHELNTPLSVVMAAVETLADDLKDDCLGPESREDLFGLIQQNVERLRNNVRRLILFMQLEWEFQQGFGPPHVSEGIDLNDTVRLAQGLLGEVHRDKGLVVEMLLADDLPLLTCSPDRLETCIHELLSNAYRFCPAQAELVIETAMRAGDRVGLRLSHPQRQIDSRKLELVYLPFWQSEALNTRHTDGLGLGIPITKRLLRSMGGDLTVQLDGDLLTFRLEMPLQRGEAPCSSSTGS